MDISFPKEPLCEACQKEPANSFSSFDTHRHSQWKFVGNCSRENEIYYMAIPSFFKSPESTIDWLAHMSEKQDMDWADFMKMIHRFRAATGSFGKI